MTRWTSDAVLKAAAAWAWVPPDTHQILTSDYRCVTRWCA